MLIRDLSPSCAESPLHACGSSVHSGTSNGLWSDAGEHLVETVVCHGSTRGGGGKFSPRFNGQLRNFYHRCSIAATHRVPCDGALLDKVDDTFRAICRVTQGSHHWTSDGASSVYAPTSDSFRIYMFREGDDAGVPTAPHFNQPPKPVQQR